MSHRSGNPETWSECRWVKKTVVIRRREMPSCHSLTGAPRPASNRRVSPPASTSMLGPKRSGTGIGDPVPSKVTVNSREGACCALLRWEKSASKGSASKAVRLIMNEPGISSLGSLEEKGVGGRESGPAAGQLRSDDVMMPR